jgi:shikimate kinase
MEVIEPLQRIVLLGAMGAGKSTVGERLAARLGWRHVDLDREIERRRGLTVADIFRIEGERVFRAWEVALTLELLDQAYLVLSPGGGWVTNPGLLERLGPQTLTVWLQASPKALWERLRQDWGTRPLLHTPQPLETLAQLVAQREPAYRRADVVVATEGRTIDEVVEEVFAAALERGAVPQPLA